jgi:glyoxylase-like metal-dependent hydrolase (beta-lactamase superfamily II)
LFWGIQQRCQHGPIEGLKVGRFNFGVNTSFVIYRIGTTWIDAGPPNRWRQVERWAQEKPVENVLLTHHHEDHSGNAFPLQEKWGARVLAPALSLPLLRQGFPIQFYRRQVWGLPKPVIAEALECVWEDPGGYRWEVVPTPGHADDMVCLFERSQGWLFSADLYVATRVRYGRREDRLQLEIESLRRVLQLPFETLFCSHRGPVPNGRQALQGKLDYLVSLRQQACELQHQGHSLAQITRALLGREDHVSYLSGFHFCKSHLIRACLMAGAADPG